LRYLHLGSLYLLVYAALAFALAGHPVGTAVFGNAALLFLPIVICVIVLRRRREWAGTQRLFWDSFLVGMVLWIIGHAGWAYSTFVLHRPGWVQWHTLFTLCGGLGPLVALIALPHVGPRQRSTAAIAVAVVSYAMLGAFIYAYFVLVPGLVPGAREAESTMFVLVQIQRLLLVCGTGLLAWRARGTDWRPTYLRLLAGVTAGFFVRFVTSRAIVEGSYYAGSFYDLTWILPYLCYAWAAAAAPATDRAQEARETARESPTLLTAIPVFLIPAIGYGFVRAVPLGDPGDSFRILLTTLTTVAGLGLITLRLVLQGSELQRADARLRLLAAATEQTGDLILITRANGTIEHANDAAVNALGYTRDELVRMTLYQLMERGFEQTIDDVGTEVRNKGIWRGTLVHRRKNGNLFPAASTVVALRSAEGRVTHFVGVQRDITEELQLRDQLVNSERLSAIGELVAGVAHELNNPLQTIIGSAELLIEERRGQPPNGDLQMIRQEATRAGQIVRNLLSFVRRGSAERTETDLNEIVRAMATLRANHLTLSGISLELHLDSAPLKVVGNREELQQVVFNLLLNAEHAIGERGGTIRIRTEHGATAHSVTVSDSGPGVSPDLRGRIFEPFFTTKPVGQGTGLGLSISFGVATAHGGSLELCPSDVGACFKLTLPACARSVTSGEVSPEGAGSLDSRFIPPKRPEGANAEIPVAKRVEAEPAAKAAEALIIDDELPIRTLLKRLLTRRGYDVAEAASLADGTRAATARSFDLILCDVRLGDGSGVDCLRTLRALQPEVDRKFVFVTGDAGQIGDASDLGEVAVLTKPFTAADLDRVLEAVFAKA
jgi:PAS domain S-box-containing protein